jgi:hypothetical protein
MKERGEDAMMNYIWRVLLALVMAVVALSPATAREAYTGFVKEQFYLGRGGIPAPLELVAKAPLSVLRSEAVYMNLRAHVGSLIGRPLNDEEFRVLLASDDVRLVPCVGSIDTAGVSASGRFGWRVRPCYVGEKLIEAKLKDGSWLVVASEGCYNPVRGKRPSSPPPIAPPPPPIAGRWQCDMVETSRTSQVAPATLIPGSLIAKCDTITLIPPLMVGGGLQSNSSTSQMRCVWIKGSN